MIELHRLNGDAFILNPHHIEVMESTPDTVITLTNEKKYIVRERIPEVVEKIREYDRQIFSFIADPRS
jgi:flagellar protein FlbD